MSFPRRYLVYVGLFLLMFINYLDRINLSVAAKDIAQNYGLQYILYFALAGQVLGLLLAFFLKETSPRKTGAAEAAVAAAAVI